MSAAPRYATQASYDGFLGVLAANGVVPGTVVIDDKWHRAYGTCEPDTVKWPDLAAGSRPAMMPVSASCSGTRPGTPRACPPRRA